jgi:hypothetical protein
MQCGSPFQKPYSQRYSFPRATADYAIFSCNCAPTLPAEYTMRLSPTQPYLWNFDSTSFLSAGAKRRRILLSLSVYRGSRQPLIFGAGTPKSPINRGREYLDRHTMVLVKGLTTLGTDLRRVNTFYRKLLARSK